MASSLCFFSFSASIWALVRRRFDYKKSQTVMILTCSFSMWAALPLLTETAVEA